MPADIFIENAKGNKVLERLDSTHKTKLATLKVALGGKGKLRGKGDNVLSINPDWTVEAGTYVWTPDEPQQEDGDAQNVVERPTFFGGAHDSVWESYLTNKPSLDTEGSQFLSRIAEAKVSVFADVTSGSSDTDWNWPEETDSENSISVVKVDFPADEEAMNDGITMVRLPLANPHLPEASKSRKIFVRNEDVGLIKHWSSPSVQLDDSKVMRMHSVVLGNPGISKSWHLWKYLIMAANSELWKNIAGDVDFPCQPKVIVFVTSDISVRVHYLEDKVVHKFKSLSVLESLNVLSQNGSVRMLYEPAASTSPIPHDLTEHSRIPCVAALSPLLIRYKEYLKQYNQAAPHIMPCPTWPEIEAITRFLYENGSEVDVQPIVDLVRKRYKLVGPFLRILFSSQSDYDAYEKDISGALKNMALEEANGALRTIESTETSTIANPSHRFARYITPKSHKGDFTYKQLVPASEATQNHILDRLNQLSIVRLQTIMVHYEDNTDDSECNPKALKTLLCKYIVSPDGLKWSYGLCQITLKRKGGGAKATSTKQAPLNLKKKTMCYSPSPKASEMKDDKLYQPRNVGYPFVDLLWVDKSIDESNAQNPPPLSTSQCTVSETHPKNLSVYNKLRKSLDMLDNQLLIVYLATLPRCVEKYLLGQKSTFFSGTSKRSRDGEEFSFPNNVEFRVLLPHKEMKNSQPDAKLYEDAIDKVYTQPERSSSSISAQTNATSPPFKGWEWL